jgi:hypothetical protein
MFFGVKLKDFHSETLVCNKIVVDIAAAQIK